MNLVNDAIYWCCNQPIESEDYGMTDPLTPWRGKLRIVNRNGGQVLYFHRFNHETGEIDEDSNATSIVKEHEIFETRALAVQAYINLAIYAARSHMHEANQLLESIGKVQTDDEREH